MCSRLEVRCYNPSLRQRMSTQSRGRSWNLPDQSCHHRRCRCCHSNYIPFLLLQEKNNYHPSSQLVHRHRYQRHHYMPLPIGPSHPRKKRKTRPARSTSLEISLSQCSYLGPYSSRILSKYSYSSRDRCPVRAAQYIIVDTIGDRLSAPAYAIPTR